MLAFILNIFLAFFKSLSLISYMPQTSQLYKRIFLQAATHNFGPHQQFWPLQLCMRYFNNQQPLQSFMGFILEKKIAPKMQGQSRNYRDIIKSHTCNHQCFGHLSSQSAFSDQQLNQLYIILLELLYGQQICA